MKTEGKKREEILTSALNLFAEIGFEATPVPAIADKAKVGVGTIYRYFKNKNVLVNDLYFHWKSLMHEQVLLGFNAATTYEGRFKALCRQMSLFGRENPVAFEFLELHIHSTYLDKRNTKKTADFLDFVSDFIREGIREKRLKIADAEMIIALVYGGIIGAHETFGKDLTDKQIQQMLDLFWSMIKA